MRTISFIIFLILIEMFSPSAEAQVPPLHEMSGAVTEEEVHRLIGAYTAQFMKMDVDAFMALFSKGATENRMLPYADIRRAFKRTVVRSKSIVYHLKIYSVQMYAQTAFVTGRYEIIQSLKKRSKREVFRGDIQWDLVLEDGSLRIREINYGRDR